MRSSPPQASRRGRSFTISRTAPAYLVALHRRFHDALADEFWLAVGDMAPGRERLATAARTYLDGCLRDRGVKALLLEARGHRPIADEVLARNRRNVDIVTADFEAIGRRHPRLSARLWVAATAECALIELELGRADSETREASTHSCRDAARRATSRASGAAGCPRRPIPLPRGSRRPDQQPRGVLRQLARWGNVPNGDRGNPFARTFAHRRHGVPGLAGNEPGHEPGHEQCQARRIEQVVQPALGQMDVGHAITRS